MSVNSSTTANAEEENNKRDNTGMAANQQSPQPADDAEPQIGTTINEWRITGRLGTGVFGAVFKCKRAKEDNNDTSSYAMKVGLF